MSEPSSVLIVDDDAGTRETLGDVLRLKGYTVHTARKGRECLGVLASAPVDLAILDIKLPDISGLELLDAVKRASPRTEVIFVTAYASITTAVEAINGAAFAYLVKPFEMDDLVATLRKAREKQQLARALYESEERYRLVTENILDAVVLLDTEARLVFGNPRCQGLTGYRVDELQGQPIFTLLTPDGARQARALLEAVLAGGDVPPFFETQLVRKDGVKVWVEANLTSIVKDGRIVALLGAARDITPRKEAERRQAAEYAVGRVLAEAPTVEAAGKPVLRAIGEALDWEVGGLWVVDTEANVSRVADMWHAAAVDIARFEEGSRQSTCPRGVGIPGRVWNSAEPLWIPDVRRESIFARARVAPENLHASFAFPISLGRDVVGVVEFFSHEIRPPDQALLQWTSSIGRQIAQFIERKRAEGRLRDTNETLEALIQSSPVAVIALDLDGRVTRWSRSAERIFGWSEGEAVGRPLRIIPGGEEANFRRMFDQWKRGAVETDLEVVQRRKDGALIQVSLALAPLRDAAGRVTGTIANCTDITDRKRSEAALKDSEERFRATFEQAAVGIGHAAPDGRWLRVNRRLCDMLGYTREELLTRSLRDITDPEDLGSDRAQVRRVLANEIRTYSIEKRYLHKDGAIVWVNLTVSLVWEPSGEPRYFIFIIQDITERKQLEQELLHAQKMEGIGQLAGGIAHDFNNLMTVIVARSELNLERLQAADPLRKDLELIHKTAHRAATLTRQLLAFSRKQVLQPKVIDPNELIGGSTRLLRRLIGEDIELTFRPVPDVGRIRVDPGQLEQVIVNLAVNARDAMPQGGRLTIETADVELDASYAARHVGAVAGAYVVLAVSDTGIGMDSATRARIFEPFFTTKGPGKGTGLGLATVYGIVKQSGGNIWVYSEPGVGSTFKMYFPRVEEPADAASAPSSTTLPTGTETVLVVEDADDVRRIACDVLESLGYNVLEAATAGDALLISERHPGVIQLLLTDVVMPRMSGSALAARIAGSRPETKILYVSGYPDDAIVRHGVLEPGTAFLEKPFTPEALAVKVRQVLDTAG